ncbi:radical SAM/SPASM domain-containing protein [uncultured Ruminococcus sp.]|uniref:radical SAM/SPASM domain-containing protein n=1 Tax=uncultured Ruminococcus sp. TaxID=165186 RepID=UPI0025FCD7C8|nr:radical SAM protein [uncultured Ruminococcus sp.]
MQKVESYYELDKARISAQKRNINKLQSAGLYPDRFDLPLLLQFELTRKCNVFCKHCYNNSGRDNSVADAMTPEKWKNLCKYLVEHGGIFECILSGGEPLLLGNDLFDIMDILHDDGTYFLLITNGFLLTREIVDRLIKYRYKWIQVSIDGATADFHDAFRRRIGSWERAVKGAFMVSSAGLPLTIAHSVSPQNLNDVDEMCDLAYSLGAGNLILGTISLSGRTFDNDYLVLSPEENELLLEKIEFNANRFRGKMQIQRSLDERLQFEQNVGIPNGGLIIRPDGNIRLDCMTPFVLGNVLSDDLIEIWRSKGVDCWDRPEVKAYYEHNGVIVKNYVDDDILL